MLPGPKKGYRSSRTRYARDLRIPLNAPVGPGRAGVSRTREVPVAVPCRRIGSSRVLKNGVLKVLPIS